MRLQQAPKGALWARACANLPARQPAQQFQAELRAAQPATHIEDIARASAGTGHGSSQVPLPQTVMDMTAESKREVSPPARSIPSSRAARAMPRKKESSQGPVRRAE